MGRPKRVFICGTSRVQTRDDVRKYFQRYEADVRITFHPEDKYSQSAVNWSFAYAYFKNHEIARNVVTLRHHEISGKFVECCMTSDSLDTDRIERLKRLQSTVFVGGLTRNHTRQYFTNLVGNTNILIFEPDLGYAVVAFRSLRTARDVVELRFIKVSGETLEWVSFFDKKQVKRLKRLYFIVFVEGMKNQTRDEVYQYFTNISKGSFSKCLCKDGYAVVTFKSAEAATKVVEKEYHEISGREVVCRRSHSK